MLTYNDQQSFEVGKLIPFNKMNKSKCRGLSNLTSNCGLCAIKRVCEHSHSNAQTAEDANLLSVDQNIYHKNNAICRQGDAFNAVYVVRSGTVKTFTLNVDGEMQVTGFYSAGEVIGLDGIYRGEYQSSAVALDTVSICRVVIQDIDILSQQHSLLLPSLLQAMSAEIYNDKAMFLTLSKKSVEYRLASFLVNYSVQLKKQKLSYNCFNIPMTRNDLGNYLGMAVETVSREITRLQQNGIIQVAQREIKILDRARLEQLTGATEKTLELEKVNTKANVIN